jgi:hypothetical protein
VKNNVRGTDRNYLLVYNEGMEIDKDYCFSNFSYPYNGYSQDFTDRKGLTLRETFILLMFEWWRNRRFFTKNKNGNDSAQIIPCFGSICSDGDYEKTYLPIPLVYVTKDNLDSVWASTNGHRPSRPDNVRVLRVEKTFEI